MPALPVILVLWLTNAGFVVIPVLATLLTMTLMVHPPCSVAEVVFETYKIILVATVSLSGVALMELLLLSGKLRAEGSKTDLFPGGAILITDIAIGILLFSAALQYGLRPSSIQSGAPHPAVQVDISLIAQILLSLVVLISAIWVAIKYKHIEIRIASYEAEKTKRAEVPK